VSSGELEGGFQVAGASAAENVFTMDGVATNSLINGGSRQNARFDLLEEGRIVIASDLDDSAERLGGVIAPITKSGSDVLRGDTLYVWEESPLSAQPPLRLALDPRNQSTTTYVQDREQRERDHDGGGSLGGPIVRRHLWFFSSLSSRFDRR